MQITIDEKLKLLAGLPILCEGYGKIKPKKIKEIIEVGYTHYMSHLNLMTITKQDINPTLPTELTDFDVLFYLSDDLVQQNLKETFEFFLDDKVTIYKEDGLLVVGNEESEEDVRVIHQGNFDNIRKIIQLQNGLASVDDVMDKVNQSDKAREIAERMKKAKDEINKIKRKDGNEEDESDFFDMLSAISSKSQTVSKIDLLDFTMFQIYEEFKRICIIDQYTFNVMALMQGAKNIKLKHWSSKIKI